jgi:chorismate mutase/prephenate dehydratase
MVRLFMKRMDLSEEVIRYKLEHQLPIFDKEREQLVLERVINESQPGDLEDYVRAFVTALMDISKEYQKHWLDGVES